jgi:DNA-binding transcriptional regulator LsrR (DeoR family)
VQLTAAQQVYQLYNQGQTVSQIASSLSLTEAVVNGYLNVTSTG